MRLASTPVQELPWLSLLHNAAACLLPACCLPAFLCLQVSDADIDPVQELPALEGLKAASEGANIAVRCLPVCRSLCSCCTGLNLAVLVATAAGAGGGRLVTSRASSSSSSSSSSPQLCAPCTHTAPRPSPSPPLPFPSPAPLFCPACPSLPLEQELLKQTAVLKLNGGLGPSMGLEKAKSLLEVKSGKTFLDLIAEQIKHTRQKYGACVRAFEMRVCARWHGCAAGWYHRYYLSNRQLCI